MKACINLESIARWTSRAFYSYFSCNCHWPFLFQSKSAFLKTKLFKNSIVSWV